MAISDYSDVTNQVQKYWAPIFSDELRESLLLGSLVNRDYEGEIKKGGDTVYVSQISAPTGQLLDVDTDGANSFESESISTSRVAVRANKRAVAAYEFADIVEIQSQIDKQDPKVMQSLLYAMNKQINDYLYTLVSPSTSAPDHELSSITDMNAAQLSAIRVLAGEAKWAHDKPWFGLLSPAYYADVMDDTTLASADYGAVDKPMVSGQLSVPRMGFNLLEDTSRSGDYGLFFHPDFLHMVMQPQVQVKISDQHANKRFGYLLSVDIIFGAILSTSGNVKHIRAQ